ncbi:Fe/S biogenesis protein NfuA [Psychromonas marina]|uniref:Fe/S biogenesis protein NfuA n=1 Tax=Psychromonas marina TaxID=88364 RepID=A0ABQ6E0E2_9GAMM|nr:Fe-S biogenesis protein NfuA [Psychromonas marina]GLS90820.1 Fe/S biogenesis protein NfuA [Psychromonas marina]
MIDITPSAEAHFRKLLEPQKEGTSIRVFVINPGTPKAECGVSYCPPEAVESSDTRLSYEGFDALVDDVSLPFLDEAFIDLVEEDTGTQLTLKAPNAKMRKVKDDAPLMDRVEYVIQVQINPQLASHGGFIKLIELTEDNVAVIEFGGGCNGCSQVDLTLKEGIEKELLEEFSGELNAVRDITEHQSGDHSFYK